jgi:hypothetical protein
VTEANGSQVEFVPWRSQKEKALSLPLLVRMMQHKGYPLQPATATRGEGVQRVK